MIRILTVLVGSCCVLLATQAEQKSALKVQLNIFSGRPDPVFWITDREIVDEILGQIRLSPPPQPGQPTTRTQRIGYRGFTLTPASPNAQSPMFPAFTVYRSELGILSYTGSAAPEIELRIDAGRSVERKLIALLKEAKLVEPELLDHIEAGNRPAGVPPGKAQP